MSSNFLRSCSLGGHTEIFNLFSDQSLLNQVVSKKLYRFVGDPKVRESLFWVILQYKPNKMSFLKTITHKRVNM